MRFIHFRVYFFIFCCHFLLMQTAYSVVKTDSLNSNNTIDSFQDFTKIDSLLQFSKLHIGKPYRGGGKGPNAFDCSGFTSFVFRAFDVELGASSRHQAKEFFGIQEHEIVAGDLVFFNGRRRGNRIGHVGIVVSRRENGTFDFIHAASSVGVSISHSESPYYRSRYMGAGRVFCGDTLFVRQPNNSQQIQSVAAVATELNEQCTTQNQHETLVIPAQFHIVKSGETLSSIASKHRLTVSQLKRRNGLKSDFLALRQRLLIREKQEIQQVVKPNVVENRQISIINERTSTNDSVQSQVVQHLVSKGESLYFIAKKYNLTVLQLKAINGLSSSNIQVGQRLQISNATTNSNVISTHQKVATATTKYHYVKSGDTLSAIAEKYNCTVKQLKKWNSKKSNKINIGEKLKIVG